VSLEPVSADEARVLRGCGHGFCSKASRSEILRSQMCEDRQVSACPLCRARFSPSDLIGRKELGEAATSAAEGPAAADDHEAEDGAELPPPKVLALLQSLRALREKGEGDKAVVFSQFTAFLDVMEPILRGEGFGTARIDGKLSNKNRKAALESFASVKPGSPEASHMVMLASLMAAGTGINLTSANHCFIADPWWNGSVEQQAMDRVHRIGQTKPVTVVKLVAADTVEGHMLKIQEAKEALGIGALRKLSPEELRKSRMGELRRIFDC
ncbi:unnamed protein product, partial [Discosporangium mesarthrocarpum]